jgi:hypothetical protein
LDKEKVYAHGFSLIRTARQRVPSDCHLYYFVKSGK